MKEVLFLIGGSGFIGKKLCGYLKDRYTIFVFDKNIDKEFFNRNSEISTAMIELDKELISKEVPAPDYIINLASIVTAERDLKLFDKLINSNLKVLLNLYERFKDCKNLKLFIQFGSAEEYGTAKSPFKEDMREEPNSPYALIKQLTTNMALMLHKNYKFPAMVVRPGNLFGEGQNENKFIPYVIRHLKMNEQLDVTGCEQKRDFISISDFTKAIHAILSNYDECLGRIINVSSGISMSLKEIIEHLKNEIGSESRINYGAIPYRENEAMDLCCDTTLLERILKIENLKSQLDDII